MAYKTIAISGIANPGENYYISSDGGDSFKQVSEERYLKSKGLKLIARPDELDDVINGKICNELVFFGDDYEYKIFLKHHNLIDGKV